MFLIQSRSSSLSKEIQHKIDTKTKPLGALGKLEHIGKQVCEIQHTLFPVIDVPAVVVFAGDHGLTEEGISPYPQEVTYQMVMNFLQGGAAINVFAKQHGISLNIVDAGVNYTFPDHLDLTSLKLGYGTRNALKENAISDLEYTQAFEKASQLITGIHHHGTNCIMFGEMGIGNTSSAALIMHYITGEPLSECVGRGTGLDDEGLAKKQDILESVVAFHGELSDVKEIVLAVGGYEILMMMVSILKAAELKMCVLIDGFIATSAALLAHKLYPEVIDYCIFTHQSDENGHKKMLNYLNVEPLLQLDMRLGEGSGAAVAFPLVKSAVAFINEMASFESAKVSTSDEA